MKSNIYQPTVTYLKSLNNLFIEMTAKNCNQRCKHCYIDFPKYKKEIDFISIDLIKQALNDSMQMNLHCIYLTGAEPMLHPDFNAILRLCLKRANVCICTNGSFIKYHFPQSLFLLHGNAQSALFPNRPYKKESLLSFPTTKKS